MKKLFIHIGPHKTGSTYIQKNLLEQSSVLLEQGVLYPEKLVGPQWGHHKLVEKIKKREKDSISNFFETEAEKILISSENFEDLSEADVRYFSEFTSDYVVEIIFFKRSYSKLLVSAWQESVKQGEAKTWSEFFLSHALKPFRSKILNSSSVIECWSQLASHLHIFDYDAMLSGKLDIAQTMCSKVLGVDLPVKPAAVNRSMNLADIEVIRILNHRFNVRTGKHPRTRVRDAYLKLKSEKDDTVAQAFELISKELVEETLDDSWTINFFENKFNFKSDMYFAKNNVSRKTYLLPCSNSALNDRFFSLLSDIEYKLDV
jgi:hypothetical protein